MENSVNLDYFCDTETGLTEDGISQRSSPTLQEHLALWIPHIILSTIVLVLACFLYDPTLKLLLYSAIPERYQNWLSFGICYLEEARFILIQAGLEIPVCQLQLTTFEDINMNLTPLIHSRIRRGPAHIRGSCKALTRLHLYINLLNIVNRHLIFTWKLLSIGLAIISGYAAIAHFSEYPIFGIMYYVLLFDMVFIYATLYGKTFKIPALVTDAKAALVVRAGKWGDRFDGRLVRREVRSIPSVGIKVGDFQVLERAAIPMFLHYVVTNIVSMLVALE